MVPTSKTILLFLWFGTTFAPCNAQWYSQVCKATNLVTVGITEDGRAVPLRPPGGDDDPQTDDANNETTLVRALSSSSHLRSSSSSSSSSSGHRLTESIFLGDQKETNNDNNFTTIPPEDDFDYDDDFFVQKISARVCDCPGTDTAEWVCKADADLCGIPYDPTTEPVGCYQFSVTQVIARNAWPLLFLWYFGLLVVLLCTIQGKTARDYCIGRWCTTRPNQVFVDRLLRGDLTNVDVPGFRWRFWTYNQRRLERGILAQGQYAWRMEAQYNMTGGSSSGGGGRRDGRKQTLELRTKRYQVEDQALNSRHRAQQQEQEEPTISIPPTERTSPTDNNNTDDDNDSTDDDQVTCSICFAPLEHGDRIGDLACGHTFHVDCLKTWLPRRNTCPLCQAPNVARMRPMTDEELAREQEREQEREQQRQLEQESSLSDSVRNRRAISLSLLFPSMGTTARRRAAASNNNSSSGSTSVQEVVLPTSQGGSPFDPHEHHGGSPF